MTFINLPSSGADNYKEPVENLADLPTVAAKDDIRFVSSEASLYYFNGNIWQELTTSGGGGDASTTTYTPIENNDWDTVPNDVADALDELAQKTINTRYKIEIRTLTAGEITAKQITLAETPKDSSKVMLDPLNGGVRQEPGVSFSVTGNILSWDGLTLDGIFSTGEKIVITYT